MFKSARATRLFALLALSAFFYIVARTFMEAPLNTPPEVDINPLYAPAANASLLLSIGLAMAAGFFLVEAGALSKLIGLTSGFAVWLAAWFMLDASTQVRLHGPISPCLSTVKQIGTAANIYMMDSDNRLPAADWIEKLQPYTRTLEVHCWTVPKPGVGYAMNQSLVAANAHKHSDQEILFYDSRQLQHDAVGDASMDLAYRHRGKANVAHLDSSAKPIPERR